MNRQFGHVKILKRAGRGHDPSGIEATQEGSCAVICPACPQPGRNLPSNWRNAPDNIKYVNFLLQTFLSLRWLIHFVQMAIRAFYERGR